MAVAIAGHSFLNSDCLIADRILIAPTTCNGDLDLRELTDLRGLKNVRYIEGNLDAAGLEDFTNLGDLEYIGKDLYLNRTGVVSLGNVKTIRGNAHLRHTRVADLGRLQYAGNLNLRGLRNLASLGQVESVGGLDLRGLENLKDLNNLYSVEKDMNIRGCGVNDLSRVMVKGKIFLDIEKKGMYKFHPSIITGQKCYS
jgi:hypothetical protein